MAKKKGKSQGPKWSKLEVAKRRQEIADLLAAQVASKEIEDRISERYGISTRMVRKDIQIVYENWEKESRRERGFRRGRMRNTLMAFYQRCMARRQYTAALGALDRLCKLDGLFAPEKLEITHDGEIDVSQMTSAQVRDRIEFLLKKRRELLDGTLAPDMEPA